MKETEGKANPKVVNELLREKLERLSRHRAGPIPNPLPPKRGVNDASREMRAGCHADVADL